MGFKDAEMFVDVEEYKVHISISMEVGDHDNFIFGSDIAEEFERIKYIFRGIVEEIWYQFTIVTPEESEHSSYALNMDISIDLDEHLVNIQQHSVGETTSVVAQKTRLIKEIDKLYPKWFQG